MPSFLQLITIAVATAGVLAAPQANGGSSCVNAQVARNETLAIGGKSITVITYTCDAASKPIQKRGLLDGLLCVLFGINCPPKTPAPPPAPRSVCSAACTPSCNSLTGVLPPTSEDCDQIRDALQIFQTEQPDAFTVDPNHMESLNFGTCSVFFENFSSKPLQYCWSSLSANSKVAGDHCFPPNQPFFPQGLCTGNDGTWAVGTSHS